VHGVWAIECAWDDAYSQAVIGAVVMSECELVKTGGDGGSELAVGDAMYVVAADVVCDLGNSRGFTEWDL
jgi:hypothetical protein